MNQAREGKKGTGSSLLVVTAWPNLGVEGGIVGLCVPPRPVVARDHPQGGEGKVIGVLMLGDGDDGGGGVDLVMVVLAGEGG